jgi:hypothetical protein
MTNQLPVDKIMGVKDRQSRDTVERRGHHIIAVTYSHHIGIGIIGMKNRIFIGSVSLIRYPGFGNFRS